MINKKFSYKSTQGLPGGPNELKKFITGSVSVTGYKSDSPDVDNDFNIIPSNRITMEDVEFPVLGIDNLGNEQMMIPGGEYTFPGDYVTELPQMGKGGLTQWFAEDWRDVKTGKKCGRSGKKDKRRSYPACRPSKRVNKTTPKTTKEMSSAELAKFKREKKSGERIDYNHERTAKFGGQTGWLDTYQDGGVPKRVGSRPNPDGTVSTHLMRAETLDGKNWMAFPSLFQNPDSTWVDMSQQEDWIPVYEEAKRRGEVINFGTDKEAALNFGKGSWKKQKGGETSTETNPTRMAPIDISVQRPSWFERNIERPLERWGHSVAQRLDKATGGKDWYKQSNPFPAMIGEMINLPQLTATYAATGKAQTPSEAMDIQNPYGAFAVDALLDPTNLAGAGVIKKTPGSIKNLVKSSPKGFSRDVLDQELYNVSARNMLKDSKGPLRLEAPQTYYRATSREKLANLIDPINLEKQDWEKPEGLTFFGTNLDKAKEYLDPAWTKSDDNVIVKSYMDFKNPYRVNQNEVWTNKRIKDLKNQGYDVIYVDPKKTNNYRDALEIIPLDKNIIKDVNIVPGYKKYGGWLDQYQYGGHSVRPGETFYGIANKYGLGRQDLVQANPNINIDKLQVGQRIALPEQYEGEELIPGYFETKDKSIFGSTVKQPQKAAAPAPKAKPINIEGLKKGIAEAESRSGKLMINPESTATGLYGQRFSELMKAGLYKGTRKQFAKDTAAQNKIFQRRLKEGITSNTGLLQDADDLYKEYAPQIDNFDYSKEDLVALSNFLGRQGTRNYLGYHVRDKKPLSQALPNIYGSKAKQANKTPQQYLNITRKYYKQGGQTNWLENYN